MIKYLLVAIFFIAALSEIYGRINIAGQLSTILPFFVFVFTISIILKIHGKNYFIVGLIFLVISIYQLSLKDQIIAEKASVWCYIFIFEGLLLSIFSYSKK